MPVRYGMCVAHVRASEVTIPDMRHGVFLLLLEYLYTDQVEVNLESAMELFQVGLSGVVGWARMCCGRSSLHVNEGEWAHGTVMRRQEAGRCSMLIYSDPSPWNSQIYAAPKSSKATSCLH